MCKVYNWQERPKGEPSVTGNGKEPEYAYRIDENGMKTLEKVGEVDVYAQIQTYLEETKIENIFMYRDWETKNGCTARPRTFPTFLPTITSGSEW